MPHYHYQIIVPETSYERVIFKYKNFSKSFEREFYHPSQTENRASPEHVNQVLSEVESIVRDKLGCVNCLSYILLLYILGMMAAFFMMAKNGNPVPAMFFGGFGGMVFLAFILGCFRRVKVEEAKRDVNQLLTVHNERLRGIGLRWSIPSFFPMWIELHNDFRFMPGFVVVQPVVPHVIGDQSGGAYGILNQQPPGFNQGYYAPPTNNYYPPQQNMQYP